MHRYRIPKKNECIQTPEMTCEATTFQSERADQILALNLHAHVMSNENKFPLAKTKTSDHDAECTQYGPEVPPKTLHAHV